jgi:hypothetical protein
VTQIYLSPLALTAPITSRVASAAGRLRSSRVTGNWPTYPGEKKEFVDVRFLFA